MIITRKIYLKRKKIMKCPRCNTNVLGNVPKCPVCNMPLFPDNQAEIKKENQNHNGILDQRDLDNYTKNIELYKTRNKTPNIAIPIIIILLVIIVLIIIAFSKFIG